jgi:hypothetical protein
MEPNPYESPQVEKNPTNGKPPSNLAQLALPLICAGIGFYFVQRLNVASWPSRTLLRIIVCGFGSFIGGLLNKLFLRRTVNND